MTEKPAREANGDADDSTQDVTGDERVTFVRSEIERWRREQTISDGLARRLLAEYEPQRGTARTIPPEDDWPRLRIPLTPGMVLLCIGGLLIVVAAIMLIADVWSDLGDGGRFALVLLPTLVLYGVGGYLHAQQSGGQRAPAQVMLFFGCLLVPFVVWLGSECVVGGGHGSAAARMQTLSVALLSFVIHVATLFWFRSPLLTIPYPLSAVWLAGQAMDCAAHEGPHVEDLIAMVILVCGLALIGVGVCCTGIGKPTYATMPDMVGTACTLGATFSLGVSDGGPGWEFTALLVSLLAIGASVWRRNQRYLFLGAAFLVINIFHLGFEYFQDTAGLPLTLLICGGLSMALGYVVHRVRKDYLAD